MIPTHARQSLRSVAKRGVSSRANLFLANAFKGIHGRCDCRIRRSRLFRGDFNWEVIAIFVLYFVIVIALVAFGGLAAMKAQGA